MWDQDQGSECQEWEYILSSNNAISYKVEWLSDGNVQVLTKQNTCFLFLQLSMEDGKLQNTSWTSTFQYLNLTTTNFE